MLGSVNYFIIEQEIYMYQDTHDRDQTIHWLLNPSRLSDMRQQWHM